MDSALISRSDILEAASKIEPLPAAITRLMSVVSEPDFDARSIVEVVNHDPALAGDVLARANSAAAGSQRRIGDLQQAAARIGANAIVDIAIRRTMKGRLSSELPAYGLDANGLWRHAVIASVAADVVRRSTEAPIAPMITTATLVHDIGKLVIAGQLPPGLVDAIATAATTDDVDLAEVEREIIGMDHGEVSGVVVRQWGLPVSVQVALTQHHTEGPTDTFTHALRLADAVAHAVEDLDAAEGEDDLDPIVADGEKAAEALGISTGDLARIVTTTADKAADVLAAYR